jgi:hypothetical protein
LTHASLLPAVISPQAYHEVVEKLWRSVKQNQPDARPAPGWRLQGSVNHDLLPTDCQIHWIAADLVIRGEQSAI